MVQGTKSEMIRPTRPQPPSDGVLQRNESAPRLVPPSELEEVVDQRRFRRRGFRKHSIPSAESLSVYESSLESSMSPRSPSSTSPSSPIALHGFASMADLKNPSRPLMRRCYSAHLSPVSLPEYLHYAEDEDGENNRNAKNAEEIRTYRFVRKGSVDSQASESDLEGVVDTVGLEYHLGINQSLASPSRPPPLGQAPNSKRPGSHRRAQSLSQRYLPFVDASGSHEQEQPQGQDLDRHVFANRRITRRQTETLPSFVPESPRRMSPKASNVNNVFGNSGLSRSPSNASMTSGRGHRRVQSSSSKKAFCYGGIVSYEAEQQQPQLSRCASFNFRNRFDSFPEDLQVNVDDSSDNENAPPSNEDAVNNLIPQELRSLMFSPPAPVDEQEPVFRFALWEKKKKQTGSDSNMQRKQADKKQDLSFFQRKMQVAIPPPNQFEGLERASSSISSVSASSLKSEDYHSSSTSDSSSSKQKEMIPSRPTRLRSFSCSSRRGSVSEVKLHDSRDSSSEDLSSTHISCSPQVSPRRSRGLSTSERVASPRAGRNVVLAREDSGRLYSSHSAQQHGRQEDDFETSSLAVENDEVDEIEEEEDVHKPVEEQPAEQDEKAETLRTIKWSRGKQIGNGSFGTVYLALDCDSGLQFAVKRIPKTSDDPVKTRQVQSEIKVMQSLTHENIVKYLGSETDEEGVLLIFLEYVSGGSLLQLIKEHGPLSINLAAKFTRHITLGIEYLHANGVLHRDIKSANVLLTQDGVAKLADFGCSKQMQFLESASTLYQIRGSIPWMAPETIRQTGTSLPADIWALGCTVLEMVSGKYPWPDLTNHIQALFSIAKAESGPPIPPHLANTPVDDFMQRCFYLDPMDRFSANELLHHPFISKLT